MLEDNLRDLCAAVIIQACKEYTSALRRNDKREIENLERFFKSDRFIELTYGSLSGETVINNLRKQNKRIITY